MSSIIAAIAQWFRPIPGRAYLLVAVIIFAAANSVTRKLTELGAQNLIDGRNPISFCNVLFVGNLCALTALLVVYHPQLRGHVLRQLAVGDWMDVASPLLWQWMVVYGAVIVVGGQLCWFAGLKRSNAAEVSLANFFNPIAGVLAAFLILGEAPTTAQYIGGFVILIGIALNQIGLLKPMEPQALPPEKPLPSSEVTRSESVGFKGI